VTAYNALTGTSADCGFSSEIATDLVADDIIEIVDESPQPNHFLLLAT